MDQKVYSLLQPLNLPIKKFIYEGDQQNYITFFEVIENGMLFADNQEQITGHYYQIDLWSDSSSTIERIYKDMKRLLDQADVHREDKQTFFEDDTKTYHYAIGVRLWE